MQKPSATHCNDLTFSPCLQRVLTSQADTVPEICMSSFPKKTSLSVVGPGAAWETFAWRSELILISPGTQPAKKIYNKIYNKITNKFTRKFINIVLVPNLQRL